MSFFSEYHYHNISQRIFVALNYFISLSFLINTLFLLLSYTEILDPYGKTSPKIIASWALSITIGLLFGRIVFPLIKHCRIVYILTEILFIFSLSLLLYLPFRHNNFLSWLLYIYSYKKVLSVFLLCIPSFFLGIKAAYFIQISSGTFFDEKKGSHLFIFALFLAFSAGSGSSFYTINNSVLYSFAPLILFPFLLLISSKYNPIPMITQTTGREKESETPQHHIIRNELALLFTNTASAVVFLFIIYWVYSSSFKLSVNPDKFFTFSSFGCISIGFILSTLLIKKRKIIINFSFLFPFLSFLSIWLLVTFGNKLGPLYASFIPCLFFLSIGISISQSINTLTNCFSQNDLSSNIAYTLFIVPAPIFAVLLLVPKKPLIYIILLYSVSVILLIIPGINYFHFTASKIKRAFYFVIPCLAIPIFIFFHNWFSDTNIYSNHLVKQETPDVKSAPIKYLYHDNLIAVYSPQFIECFQNIAIGISFFGNSLKDNYLFIDGYSDYVPLTIYNNFANSVKIDYIPQSEIDFIHLADTVSGMPTIQCSLYSSFSLSGDGYNIIADFPNIYDQNNSIIRFSNQYYTYIKEKLIGKKIYVQVFDIDKCNPDIFSFAVSELSRVYKYSISFLFGNQLMICCSDKQESLQITNDTITNYTSFIQNNNLSSLTFDATQCLSHIIYSSYPSVTSANITLKKLNMPLPNTNSSGVYSIREAIPEFIKVNNTFLNIISDPIFRSTIDMTLRSYQESLTTIKQMEYSSMNGDYESTAQYLIKLRELSNYQPLLRKYVDENILLKKDSFITFAKILEKQRLWENSISLYRSIILLDQNNFESFYKLSVISLMLQDVQSSFKYLDSAMKIKPNDPYALHQMGVLLFTSAKYKEALDFFQKAISLQISDSSTYYYMGLCYAETSQPELALTVFQQGLLKDPGNQDIAEAIKRTETIIKKKQDSWKAPERTNQNESETDVEFPLPINKSAIDVRVEEGNAVDSENPLNNQQ